MYGYVYVTTNLKNGMKYIGQHKAEMFDTSYYGSGKVLLQAIQKEGIENFTCKMLESANDSHSLNLLEAYYIEKFDAVNSDQYYNLCPGGYGKSVPGTITVNNGTINKRIMPEELSYYIAQGFIKGMLSPSAESIKKRAASNTGKKRSAETKQKISQALKGRKLSPEHRAKAALAGIGKPSYNKGLKCVTNGKKYLFVEKELVQQYLDNGYVLGGPPHNGNCSHRKGKIAVTKDNHTTFISPSELNNYLSNGFKKGSSKRTPSTTRKKGHWYTNGTQNKFIFENAVVPESFYRGRVVSQEQRDKISKALQGRPAWNKGLKKP